MKVAVDTNILLRVMIGDDERQAAIARSLLEDSEAIVISVVVLCEAIWVMRRIFKLPSKQIIDAMSILLDDPRIETDWPAYEAGMTTFKAGGDFADGVIAADSRRLGAGTVATFDRQAAGRLQRAGIPVTLLG